MEALHVPRYLAEAVAHGDQPELSAWVGALPGTVADLARRWALRLGEPYEPGERCSWVAPARDVAGAGLVLKVGWCHSESEHEADALRHWRGDGAIRLHAAETFADSTALLVERCDPGTPLADVAEPQQDVVVARLLRRLWTDPPAGHPFRPLETMCDMWAGELDEELARSDVGIDPGLVRAAMELFGELPRTADRSVLLCTDLHAENVLAARREPWLAIDPKPYLGDPAYDALQHMLNCAERLVDDPEGFLRRMTSLLDLDAGRLRLWLFARCVQECPGTPVLAGVAARLAP